MAEDDDVLPVVDEKCPQCSEPLIWGYGLAAGGLGSYVICTGRACSYIEKRSEDTGE